MIYKYLSNIMGKSAANILDIKKCLLWCAGIMLCVYFFLFSDMAYADIAIPEVIKAPVALQQVTSDEDAKLRFPSTIMFDSAETKHGAVEVMGAKDASYKNGQLHFNTTNTSSILWGRQPGEKNADFEEKFCSGWIKNSSPWVVQIKLQQKLKRSDWFLDVYSLTHGGKEKKKTLKRTLTGTGESILQFDMGLCKRASFGLRVRTETAGNQVSISWMRVRKLSLPQYFRYSFELNDVVKDGKVYWAAGGSSDLYINGKLVTRVRGQGPLWRKLNSVSIGQYLTQGKNVIAVKTDGYGAGAPSRKKGGNFFFLRGGVRMGNGNIIPILTSKQWKVSIKHEKNWMDAAFDDGQFMHVKSMGLADKFHIGDEKFDQWAEFNQFPYIGALEIKPYQRELPFFLSHEPPKFILQLLGHTLTSKDKIKYSVMNILDDTVVATKEATPSQLRNSTGDTIIDVPILSAGSYELNLEYNANGVVYKRRIEFIQTGKIKQEKVSSTAIDAGLNAKLVDEIVFANTSINDMNYGSGGRKGRATDSKNSVSKPKIKEIKGFKYIETGPSVNDWLSVKFSISDLYKPHLVKIEIPNNAKRNMSYIIAEGSRNEGYRNAQKGSGFVRASSGVYTEAPVINQQANKSITEYMVFWPNRLDQTFTVINAGGRKESPAAIIKVSIYQLDETLPEFDTGAGAIDSLIGPFIERIDRWSLASVFYSGPLAEKFPMQYVDGDIKGYYNAWYITIKNLITYLKFSGQNTLFAGLYMYNGGWLTEPRFQGRAGKGVKYLPVGWREEAVKLMAKMFQENDLNLVLSVEFISAPDLIDKSTITDYEVQQGANTLRFVSRWGNQVHGFQNGGFNFLTNDVKREMLDLASYLAEQYSGLPAVRGVMWNKNPEFSYARKDPKIKSSFDIGYGDATIKLFQQDCACKVPGDSNDPKRFAKRHRYLTTQMADQWKKWRAQKVWELNKELSNRLKVQRPDWKFIVFKGRPNHGSLKKWEHEGEDLNAFLLEVGIDPELYKNDEALSLLLTYDLLGQRKYERYKKTRDASEIIGNLNLKLLDEGMNVTDGWFFHIGFMIETLVLTQDKWPWKIIQFIGYSAPETDSLLKTVRALAHEDKPGVYVTGWNDTGIFVGRESVWRNLSLQLH